MSSSAQSPPRSLADLPQDELRRYAHELGLETPAKMSQGELLRHVRERQDLLALLDHDALLDVIVWMREPVRQSESKEALVRLIARSNRMRFDGLSDRGLDALARLRGVQPLPGEPRADIEGRIRKTETLWQALRRRRREMVGAWIDKHVTGAARGSDDEYRFLPEDPNARSLRSDIESQGVVGGIARRLRGVADDYVREKLDEIEIRIDRKLDEIDRRLSEWRDREVANRLRVLKITLLVTILVALLSLGYDWARSRMNGASSGAPTGSGSHVVEPGAVGRSAER